jgi:hypothetical protein
LAEEDVGTDIDGLSDAYDSEEDWSYAFDDDDATLFGDYGPEKLE